MAAHVPVAEAPPVQAALDGAAPRPGAGPGTGPDHRASGGFAAASPPTACPRWAIRRCAMGARRGRSPFTGYKRHVIKLVDADLIVGAVVRPANEPEHHALALRRRRTSCSTGRSRSCRSIAATWAVRDSRRCTRRAWRFARKRGPAPTAAAFPSRPSRSISPRRASSVPRQQTVADPARRHDGPLSAARRASPARCARRARRRRAAAARSRSIRRKRCCKRSAPQQQQPEGRAQLRHRTTVEHSLARVDQIQGPKARYKGHAQEHARPAPHRRRRQSPTDRPPPEGRVTLRVQLSSSGQVGRRPKTKDQRPETRDQRPETRDERPTTRLLL